jgi:SAM-dependent methyltransferase
MLHVAPEACFEPLFRKRLGAGYISADLLNPRAKVKMDVTNVEYPDEFFDVIYCSHVLEHVPDDRRAMREFYRVLKKDGWAILLVPITAESTVEDLTIVNPLDRLRLYGQEDHVRRYGPDFVDRLKDSGFKVKVSCASDLFDRDKLTLMGLTSETGDIYYCTKE